MKTIDARGEKCPAPVIMAKNALKQMDISENLKIYVDNEIACENLEKMSKVLGYECARTVLGESDFFVVIGKNAESLETPEEDLPSVGINNVVCVIPSKVMGQGDDALGESLMKAFIYSLSESETLPKAVLFYNGGAFLTAEGSPVLEELEKLQNAGVVIKTCGACLNFYNLTDKLKVGEVTNMYDIVSIMMKANVLRP